MAAPKTATPAASNGVVAEFSRVEAYLEGLRVELAGAVQRSAENVKDIEAEIARVMKHKSKTTPVETAVVTPTVETA